MKALPAVGAVLALVVSVFLLRIVVHGYTHHDHLDVFHLVVGIGSAVAGLLLMRRSRFHRIFSQRT